MKLPIDGLKVILSLLFDKTHPSFPVGVTVFIPQPQAHK